MWIVDTNGNICFQTKIGIRFPDFEISLKSFSDYGLD